MKVGIMQPYFLPYIGYFQLIASVDQFIVYDKIKYTKKGWINRNRMLLNGTDALFSLPLRKASDSLDIVARELAADFDRAKMLSQFSHAYRRAPYFAQTIAWLEHIVEYQESNLFRYIHHSLVQTCKHLSITTEIRISSSFLIDPALKGQDKVLALCHASNADTYINAIGGTELYAREEFLAHDIELKFLHPKPFEYPQFGAAFVPWLSIVDLLMFNPLDTVRKRIASGYELV